MGYCPNCGKELDLNGFCFNCGYRAKYDPPAVEVLKKHLTSPLMLITMAFIGVRFILSLLPTFYYDIVGQMQYSWGAEFDIDAALLLLGLIFIYIDSKQPVGTRIKTRGFTIIRTYQLTIALIACIALLVAALLLFVFGENIMTAIGDISLIGVDMTYLTNLPAILAAVFIVVALIIGVLYFFIYRTVSAVRNAALTGAPDLKISMVMIVLCFIITATDLIGIASEENGIVDILKLIAEAASSLTAGIALLKLKNDMNEVRNSLLPKL